ncbi:NAD(P)/FAD-dependent oxidoreductase [Profundibacterium mesophilum]|uniref:Monoamine oxidase n=1 Tax=Profundibacterium mesophilum KAUST100406-0324 TaxID=1037889 RepID=A0A921NXK5_9RHOB|nr:FAD-dependent oxidoreductase [Profundibacterium mesophilum]KAF0676584.1 monoamine oxidase [Profundibacterium mesophilum KAUST100406-0324]
MPFETFKAPPRNIAVIGGGISGMAAAHLLCGANRVVLFEAGARLGGHARTVIAGRNGDQPVDTGFIVYNRSNYPHLSALFDELDVPVVPSDMSFGVSAAGGRIEYALHGLRSLFCQPRNAADPRFLRMVADIFRFNSKALAACDDPGMTIRDLLARLRTGPWFRDYYLLPLSGAIWSTPVQGILDFPAHALVEFLDNHNLLQHSGQHQWYTVKGGSARYVERLEADLIRRGARIRTNAAVSAVHRVPGGVEITCAGGMPEQFDEVVMATHSDDSLALLADARPAEKVLLGAVRYQPNRAVLHRDTAVMPRRRRAWASWIYSEPAPLPEGAARERIDLTYWMNSLQPIPHDDPLFVTLNTERHIDEALIYDETTFRHPVFDLAAIDAQSGIAARNGTDGTWFCGAWMRNGFHEDGFASAVAVRDAMLARDEKAQDGAVAAA